MTCLSGIRVVHVANLHVFTFLVPFGDVRYDLRVTTCSIRLDSYLCCKGFMVNLSYLYLYTHARFPYHMTFVSFNSSTTCVTCGAGTANNSGAHEFTTGFSGVRVARSLVLCVMVL